MRVRAFLLLCALLVGVAAAGATGWSSGAAERPHQVRSAISTLGHLSDGPVAVTPARVDHVSDAVGARGTGWLLLGALVGFVGTIARLRHYRALGDWSAGRPTTRLHPHAPERAPPVLA